MTNEQIIKTAKRQSAVDSGCKPEDFGRPDPVVVISKPDAGARRYLKLPFFLDLTTYGTNIVASCSPEIEAFVRGFIDRPDVESCFEPPALYILNEELAKYGQRIHFMASYLLPDADLLAKAAERNICALPVRILTQPDFTGLYKPEWSNALCESRRELDVLGAAAYDGERMAGFAACSADCGDMWQIGVDVLPEYRRMGIAKALVTRLAAEIISRGKVPFYCAAWSNVKSLRCAAASGFRPSWVTITSRPIQE